MSEHATLRDAILYFADFEHCRQFMVELRWPDGKVKCPQCGSNLLSRQESGVEVLRHTPKTEIFPEDRDNL